MAFDYARLTEITTIANSAAAVYTNPTGKKSFVRLIHLHNSNTTNEIVKLYKVPDSGGSAGTAGDTNKIFEITLAPSSTQIIEYAVPGLILIDINETIQASTTTASKVTIEITGGVE